MEKDLKKNIYMYIYIHTHIYMNYFAVHLKLTHILDQLHFSKNEKKN